MSIRSISRALGGLSCVLFAFLALVITAAAPSAAWADCTLNVGDISGLTFTNAGDGSFQLGSVLTTAQIGGSTTSDCHGLTGSIRPYDLTTGWSVGTQSATQIGPPNDFLTTAHGTLYRSANNVVQYKPPYTTFSGPDDFTLDNGTPSRKIFVHIYVNAPSVTPTVTGLSPASGTTTGGTSVTITGTGFTGVTGLAGVTFGGTNATSYTVNSDTQITVVAPSGSAGAVHVIVTNGGNSSTAGAADQYTYVTPTPTVTNVSPPSGTTAGGTSVVITGTNFSGTTGLAGVTFGGNNATSYTVNSATQITAVAPSGSAGTVDIIVTNAGVSSAAVAADHYTYVAPTPTVTNVSPSLGTTAGGTSVVITGTNFSGTTGLAGVTFGGANATSYTVDSATQITAVAPSRSAGTVDVIVTNAGVSSSAGASDHYTYIDAPTVTGVSPNRGATAAGASVVITGTNFAGLTGATAVKFGANNAISYTVDSTTQITATAPSGSVGTVDITVTNPTATSATGSADRYTYVGAPTVTGIAPPSGPTGGTNSVVITGTNLDIVTGAGGVKFGTNDATSYTVNSSTQITAVAPSGSAGIVDVIVTSASGSNTAAAADQYTYVAVPTVTRVAPDAGTTSGGTPVVITGTNFGSVPSTGAVKFGASVATYTIDSATQITATSPTGSAGTVDITVASPGGTSGAGSADQFTYVGAPTVTGVSPGRGSTAGGTPVVITGTGFGIVAATGQVKFGATVATYTVDSTTQITATAPSGSVGTVDITVTNPTATSATGAADHYTYVGAPTVTGIAPPSGPTGGTNSVVITGTNLDIVTGAGGVKFGTNNATSYTVNSSTQITAVAPSGSAGIVDVIVTSASGSNTASAADQYTYVAVPTVTGVAPNSGTTSGGTTVVITGTNFGAVPATGAVLFGAAAATYTINSATQITATAPAGSAGTVDITVASPGGTSSTSSSDHFTYVGAPTVTGVSPSRGTTAGGTSVVITGTGFGIVAATGQVKFGATVATYTVDSSTQITATAPSGSVGTVDITVTNPTATSTTGASDHYTYVGAPTVTGIAPATGPTGGTTSVVITGTNLDIITGPTGVKFGAANASSYTVNSSTQITAVAPSGSAGTVDVIVTSASGSNTASAADQYTYVALPTVTGVAPSSGTTSGGTTVVITGTNFGSVPATGAVKFGAASATYTINSATQITAASPTGSAGTVDITVASPGGTSSTSASDQFTYVGAPTVTGVSPNRGTTAGGASVVITGTGFGIVAATGQVKFGGVDATYTVNSSTQITATAPAGSAGTVDITVTNPTATSTTGAADHYTYVGAPTVTGIAPPSGPTGGTTSVVITGTNLDIVTGPTGVKFGTANATSYTVDSATQITAVAPSGSAGTVDVIVTSASGSNTAAAADQYTYVAVPTVTGVSPTAGSTAGGESIVITGTNFGAVPATGAVKFGASVATYTINSATQITATAPAGSAGTVDITVASPGGTSATGAADHYTYVGAPTVTAISPNAGPTAGGTSVVITGTGFGIVAATGQVKFGSIVATYTVNSATQITATAPAGAAGTVDITVASGSGTSATSASDQFTYVAAPTLTGVTPSSGPDAGGASVVLAGGNFSHIISVKFGTTNAASYTVDSASQITAIAPAGSAGSVNVSVDTAGGSASLASAYTYVVSPAVTGLSPASGLLTGGNTVVLTGAHLTGATAVKFGSANATGVTVDSATQITVIAPAGSAGPVNVTVVTPGGTSSAGAGNVYTYAAEPTVTLVAPAAGPIAGGTSVVLTGTSFTGASAVKFGATVATSFTVDSATQITAIAPAESAGPVYITVTTPGGTSATGAANVFTYYAVPTVISLAPTSGPALGGANVVITGTNLTGATAVKFGATNATSFSVDSATQITAVSPAGAVGPVNITVTTPGGTTAGAAYTYVVAPTLSSLSPTFGPAVGGTTVVLTGTNLTGATAVKFGATNAASVTVDSATQITAVSPAGATGVVSVTVTTAGGTTAGVAYTYGNGPSVTALSPASGSPGGGTSVIITGANLTGATAVKFGATSATSFNVDSATQITAIAPAGSGSVNVTVTTSVGTSATSASGLYRYVSPPGISGVSPASGSVTGGDTVVITGTNFAGVTSVKFGSAGAASFTVDSSTQITAVTPPGTTGPVDVVVTTTGGASGPAVYTYAAAITVSGAASDGVVGSAYSASLSAAGGRAPYVFSVSAGALPSGVALSSAGALGGTPTAAGAYAFTVTAKDADGATGTASFSVTIKAAALALSGSAPNGEVGVAYSAAFSATGGMAPYQFGLSGSTPPGLSFDAAHGTLSGAPTTAGSYTFTVTVTDSTAGTHLTASQGFTVTVSSAAPPTPPAVEPVTVEPSAPGAPVAIDLSDKVDGTYTDIVITQPPQHGQASVKMNGASASIVYTPNSGYMGPDTFLYAATGPGGRSASARVVIGVLPAPVAAPDTAIAGSAKPVTINVTANDTGVFDTVALASNPSYGTATVDGLSVTYTSKVGFSGVDTFTYTVSGPGGTSAPAQVQVTVNPQASAAPPKTVTVMAGQAVVVDLTDGATGGPFTAATLVSISPSNAGAAVISSPSTGRYSLTFTPDSAFSGAAEIQYTVSNATSVSAPGKVTVNVKPRPDPTQDPEVRGLISAQEATARRFANAQISNFNRRLEQLHNGGGLGMRNGVGLQGGLTGRTDGVEAREDMRRRSAYGAAYADDVGTLRPADVRTATTLSKRDTEADFGGGEETNVGPDGKPRRWGVWASGNADVGLREAITGQKGFRFTTDGLTAGADYRVNPRLAIGVGFGYGRDSTKVGHDGTKSRADARSGGVYASFQPTEHGFIDGVVGLGNLDFDSRRYVTATGDLVTGQRDGDQLFASLTAGVEHHRGPLMISPYGRVAYSQSTLDAYTETGGGMWTLTYQSQKIRSLTGALGLKADYRYTVSVGELTPRLRLEYSHDFEGADSAGVQYADWQNGPVYRLAVDGLDRDMTRIELGVDLRLKTGLRLGLDFDNTLAPNSESHGLRLSIESAFE